MQEAVLAAFARNGGEATADELEVLTGMNGNSIRPRLVELCEANVIWKTGHKRRTRMGNMAFVYSAL